MSEPEGKVIIIKAEIVLQNKAAIFWRTTFQDEKGKVFICDKSVFFFDLAELLTAQKEGAH
jgi:hypothetical protein